MPGRLFLPGCAIAAGILSLAPQAFAQTPAKSVAKIKAQDNPFAAPIQLRVGSTASFPLASNSKIFIEEGAANISVDAKGDSLNLRGVSSGAVRVRVQTPGQADSILQLSVNEKTAATKNILALNAPVEAVSSETFITRRASSQVVERGVLPPEAPLPDFLQNIPAPTIPVAPAPDSATTLPALIPATPVQPEVAPVPVEPTPTPVPAEIVEPTPVPTAEPAVALPVAPPAPAPVVKRVMPAPAATPRVSQILPAPAKTATAGVKYKTQSPLPKSVNTAAARQTIQVTQGLARLLSFPDNILSVFFSDPAIMDARAINARTIAVTGVGPGQSTLAVFTSRYPGDAVGKANIYRLQTSPRGGVSLIDNRTPESVEDAITAALSDPRIRVSVTKIPDGTLLARLSGTVRNTAEVDAATATAKFYAPNVVTSLYADPNSPTLEAVLSGAVNLTPESGLQDSLRRASGNQTIELVPLPTGLVFKAQVDSEAEADALLRLLPSLNQEVTPFIVIRGAAESYYNSPIPQLRGEDLQLTQKLQSVTGVRSVYAVRSSSNSVSIYGNVRNRTEYEAVNRYSYVIAQASTPIAQVGTTQGGSTLRPTGVEAALPSYDPAAGYAKQLGVQMFVRIMDPTEASVRNVTVETNIVEISRTSLKNLGVQYGSATTTDEDITPAIPGSTTTVTAPDGTTTVTQNPGTPGIIERVINPAFNPGSILGGNGFAGTGGFSAVDPFRTQINALAQKGDARILASPNIRALEGSTAQITIGGERPVPSAVATNGATGQSVEFRRYGVILTMRPTVTDDNTIILQIRADVTQPDRTYEINLGGALIPGETVRSVNTTMTIRPGDTIVLGGLLTNDKRQQTSKVPLLGDLPIIGSLFRSKRYENNETELALFLTPRIDSLPATMDTQAKVKAAPGYPGLPSRQESNEILYQNNVREGSG